MGRDMFAIHRCGLPQLRWGWQSDYYQEALDQFSLTTISILIHDYQIKESGCDFPYLTFLLLEHSLFKCLPEVVAKGKFNPQGKLNLDR